MMHLEEAFDDVTVSQRTRSLEAFRYSALKEANSIHSQSDSDVTPIVDPVTPLSNIQLSDTETAAGKMLLRKATLADLDPEWLAVEIEYWGRVASQFRADLDAGDFPDGEGIADRKSVV